MLLSRRSLPALSALMLLTIAGPGYAGDVSTQAAESLLSTPDDAGWSLEAMMAARHDSQMQPTPAGHTKPDRHDDKGDGHPPAAGIPSATAALRHQVKVLQAQLTAEEHKQEALQAQLAQVREPGTPAPAEAGPQAAPPDVTARLQKAELALRAKAQDISVLTNQVSTLKAALADKAGQLKLLSAPQDDLKHALAEAQAQLTDRDAQLGTLRAGLAEARSALAEQRAAVKTVTAVPERAQHDLAQARTERSAALAEAATMTAARDGLQRERDALAASLKASTAELSQVRAQAAERQAALSALQAGTDKQAVQLAAREKMVADLTAALAVRGNELKQAATALADLRDKQKQAEGPVPDTDARRQAYMAGVLMADGLRQRLEGWQDAGVAVDGTVFRAGLTDALAGHLRLKPAVAAKARTAFMQAVQGGAVRQVTAAQKQLAALAKGLKPLKSVAGISWYRVRPGRAVRPGQAVTLSMTEQIAGGRVISRVPPLTLRPEDDIPDIVKDGMYLPGEGGEVVARGLARAVYGELPLPAGVQPWTVMEYHLTGVAARPDVSARR